MRTLLSANVRDKKDSAIRDRASIAFHYIIYGRTRKNRGSTSFLLRLLAKGNRRKTNLLMENRKSRIHLSSSYCVSDLSEKPAWQKIEEDTLWSIKVTIKRWLTSGVKVKARKIDIKPVIGYFLIKIQSRGRRVRFLYAGSCCNKSE